MTEEQGDVRELLRLLADSEATLSVAESLTGGLLAAAVTEVPGASAAFVGGVVAYATRVKSELLGVPAEVVATDGVVSARCAEAMAAGVRALLGSTWAVSTTGVAGPGIQEGKAAGTVFVGIAGPDGVTAVALALSGNRWEIQEETCRRAVDLLRDRLGDTRVGE
ncbi:nicotinamide-nucleotide amidohydrolase family protein [Nocardioides sp. 616]|uniref:CinA family protein n=1 Tax=Nocardioides sp. 616 TaxID=2268090 RepID=UPI000CE33E8D|nr:nicotinamide-nucleotide amidohydrolase family protein [Nocardioides sp. 616]